MQIFVLTPKKVHLCFIILISFAISELMIQKHYLNTQNLAKEIAITVRIQMLNITWF